MKKLILIALCAAAVVAVACSAKSIPESQPASPSEPVAPSTSSEPAPPPPMVADAAMYRGTVSAILSGTPEEGSKNTDIIVTLEQAEGTNYGAPSLKFSFTANSKYDFTPAKGQYLEVMYGRPMGKELDTDATYDIISAVMYPEAGMVNFNGTIVEITPHPEKSGEGKILMDDMSNPGFNIFFNYGTETQFYLDFDKLAVGDKLNIFHSPAMAMSMPPQCAAWEVRSYYKPADK